MYKYQNGNYNITLLKDGTKIREYEKTPEPLYPESLDLKITQYCDANCNFCHEMSTISGKHGDLSFMYKILKDLPSGTEIAIGGGNPLSHPDLVEFLQNLKSSGIVANITVNHLHLERYKDLLTFLIKDDLIKGLGISLNSKNFDIIKYFATITDNIVIHLICGVHKIEVMDTLYELFSTMGKTLKVLLLGYKQYGFGKQYYERNKTVEDKIYKWYTKLHTYFKKPDIVISFDNLGIKQLNIKRFFTKVNWEKFYMGDDGQFTMYMDAIEKTYTISSTNSIRKTLEGKNIIEIFQDVRNGFKD